MPLDEGRLAQLNTFHASHRARTVRAFPAQGHLQIVSLPPDDRVPDAVERYRRSGLVRFAEPDYVVSAATVLPNDPFFQNGTQWSLNNYGQSGGVPDADIDAPEAWAIRRFASNIVVAVIDSGVRHTHEDLTANMWVNPLDGTSGFNALSIGTEPADDNGHGTHLAGTIAAATDNGKGMAGIAWRAKIMACKFLDSAGNGSNSDAITCIEFARTNGAHVINLSWGGSAFSAGVSNALWFARADGIVVAAAAGNNAGNNDNIPFYPASLELDNIVAVAASTRGDTMWPMSNHGATSVDLFAPGESIYSAGVAGDSLYVHRNGTSMATAATAGTLALLREQAPNAPPDVLIQRLLASVDPKPAFAGKCVTGGRLNLHKALQIPPPLVVAIPNTWPLELRVIGLAGHRYALDFTPDLISWTALHTNLAGPLGQWEFTDQDSLLAPARFYRAWPQH